MTVRLRFCRCLLVLLPLVPLPARAVECSPFEHAGRRATVCHVDVRDDVLQLFLDDARGKPLNSFTRLEQMLASRSQQLLFAMNAGMYHGDYSPVGLLVIDGGEVQPLNRERGRGNFFLRPNGVFVLSDSGARVVESSQYPQLKERVMLATQSGPLLLQDGHIHPAFDAQSKSRLIRNGVGVVTPEHVVFVISEEPVNFYEFAVLFRDGLKCANALYLDGTVSSLYASDLQRSDAHTAFGPIVAVVRSAVEAAE